MCSLKSGPTSVCPCEFLWQTALPRWLASTAPASDHHPNHNPPLPLKAKGHTGLPSPGHSACPSHASSVCLFSMPRSRTHGSQRTVLSLGTGAAHPGAFLNFRRPGIIFPLPLKYRNKTGWITGRRESSERGSDDHVWSQPSHGALPSAPAVSLWLRPPLVFLYVIRLGSRPSPRDSRLVQKGLGILSCLVFA